MIAMSDVINLLCTCKEPTGNQNEEYEENETSQRGFLREKYKDVTVFLNKDIEQG